MDEPATRVKNYITPSGLQRLKDERQFLLTRERPTVTAPSDVSFFSAWLQRYCRFRFASLYASL
jgi:hypothetical protein